MTVWYPMNIFHLFWQVYWRAACAWSPMKLRVTGRRHYGYRGSPSSWRSSWQLQLSVRRFFKIPQSAFHGNGKLFWCWMPILTLDAEMIMHYYYYHSFKPQLIVSVNHMLLNYDKHNNAVPLKKIVNILWALPMMEISGCGPSFLDITFP